MKSVNILAIAAVVLAVVIAIVVLLVVFANPNETRNEVALLQCSTMTAVKEYAQRNELSYGDSVDGVIVENVPLFGTDSVVNFTFQDEAVSRINVEYVLFQLEPGIAPEDVPEATAKELPADLPEDISEDELFEIMYEEIEETNSVMQYVFTKEDREEIAKAFDAVKAGFEEYVGCGEITQYDVVPLGEGATAEDDEEKFYQGLFLKEYSVRDRNNVLWILRFHAAYGQSTAILSKIVDDSEYEGFIPVVDLTRVQE